MHVFRHDHHMEPIIVALNLFLASSPLQILHVMVLKGQAYSRRRDVHPVAFYRLCVPLPQTSMWLPFKKVMSPLRPRMSVCAALTMAESAQIRCVTGVLLALSPRIAQWIKPLLTHQTCDVCTSPAASRFLPSEANGDSLELFNSNKVAQGVP